MGVMARWPVTDYCPGKQTVVPQPNGTVRHDRQHDGTVKLSREVGIGWMYMDVIIGDPCDDVCDNCVTFATQKCEHM